MNIEILKKFVDEKLTQRQIAEKLNCSQTNVRHWLKKYKLSTYKLKLIDGKTKKCPKCKENKEFDEFYDRRGKKAGSVYCIPCSNEESRERNRKFKIKCVEYKGGKCVKCGYSKYLGALQFHHLNPQEKDFSLSRVRSLNFNEKIKQELDKCILVCSNCHFEIHGEKYI